MSYDIAYKHGAISGYDLAITDLEPLFIAFKDLNEESFNNVLSTLNHTTQSRMKKLLKSMQLQGDKIVNGY